MLAGEHLGARDPRLREGCPTVSLIIEGAGTPPPLCTDFVHHATNIVIIKCGARWILEI